MLYSSLVCLGLPSKLTEPLAPHHLAQSVKCDPSFTRCSPGADVLKAKLTHIAALKEHHGIVAKAGNACTASDRVSVGAAFSTKIDIPLVGRQSVHMELISPGVASITGTGVHPFKCPTARFVYDAEQRITLLADSCKAIPSSISLHDIRFCANKESLHATVATPFNELHIVAEKTATVKKTAGSATSACTEAADTLRPTFEADQTLACENALLDFRFASDGLDSISALQAASCDAFFKIPFGDESCSQLMKSIDDFCTGLASCDAGGSGGGASTPTPSDPSTGGTGFVLQDFSDVCDTTVGGLISTTIQPLLDMGAAGESSCLQAATQFTTGVASFCGTVLHTLPNTCPFTCDAVAAATTCADVKTTLEAACAPLKETACGGPGASTGTPTTPTPTTPTPTTPDESPSPTPTSPSSTSSPSKTPAEDAGEGAGSCFGREASMACRDMECAVRTRMVDLRAGDVVATAHGLERVVINQHTDESRLTTLLKIETADAAVTVTPDHVIHLDGRFVAAKHAAVGALLSAGAITKVTPTVGGIINPVTPSGTLFVADVAGGAPLLASTHPEWIADSLLGAPTFPFMASRLASRLAPATFQDYYTTAERSMTAAALPSAQLLAAATPSAALLLGFVAADGLFALGFVAYALAMPLGVASAYYCLMAARK